jgi:hypothetical protein
MTVFNLEERQGIWFDMEGGGRVQLKTLTADDFKAIRKQVVKKKVDFKKVDGTPGRFEFEEINEDLQEELFWDCVIVAWENLFDGKGDPIPCTTKNKILLMSRSERFAKFILDSRQALADSEAAIAEASEKN